MDDSLTNIFQPLKFLFIVLLIEILFLFFLFSNLSSNYNKNMFEIKINDNLMGCYYEEQENILGITIAGTGGYNNAYQKKNSINLEDNMNLTIKEFEVYYRSGRRKENPEGWKMNDKLSYKEVNNSITIEIKRLNKVIYRGKYINNLDDYINKKGRYYIHIYINRKESISSNIKTHIAFNVVVGGGNYDS